jgi:hypothetical protein
VIFLLFSGSCRFLAAIYFEFDENRFCIDRSII